jgi:hypothetical protein
VVFSYQTKICIIQVKIGVRMMGNVDQSWDLIGMLVHGLYFILNWKRIVLCKVNHQYNKSKLDRLQTQFKLHVLPINNKIMTHKILKLGLQVCNKIINRNNFVYKVEFIWLTLVWLIHQEIAQLQTFVDTTLIRTFYTLNVHNSFPSLLTTYHWTLATFINLGCIRKNLATFWMFPSLTLNVVVVNKAFLFTNYINFFAFIDIFKPNKTSCCVLVRCEGKTLLGRQWFNLGFNNLFHYLFHAFWPKKRMQSNENIIHYMKCHLSSLSIWHHLLKIIKCIQHKLPM